MNCFVGPREIVPGLEGDFIPRPPFAQPARMLPKKTLYMHNLSIQTSNLFDQNFENFLLENALSQSGIGSDSQESGFIRSQIKIESRRIHVHLNNAWRNLSENDFIVPLEPADADGICRGRSSLEFQKYMGHSLCGFHFRVVYEAILPLKPHPKTVTYTLGWSTYLPEIDAQREISDQRVDFFCQMGPGVATTRDVLWGFDASSTQSF